MNVFAESTYSLFELAISVCTFLTIYKRKPIEGKLINKVSKRTLGIYLIQSNPLVSSYFLWPLVENLGITDSAYWCIFALMIMFSVIAICSIIDFLSEKVYKKIDLKRMDTICAYIDNVVSEK